MTEQENGEKKLGRSVEEQEHRSLKQKESQKQQEYGAVSPLEGRYASFTRPLSAYFSEYALMRYRLKVEIAYFLALTERLPEMATFPSSGKVFLSTLADNFCEEDMDRIKSLEQETHHDIKALEYFIKEKMTDQGLDTYKEFVHFGLTSQDINNTAIPLSLKGAHEFVLMPLLSTFVSLLRKKVTAWRNIRMLARTHGQPATPTCLGKEIQVFTTRLQYQQKALRAAKFASKFGGATGELNAHRYSYPEINWHRFSEDFIHQLGLTRSYPTTQIEHYDQLASYCNIWSQVSTILLDYSKDMWQYISLHYFTLSKKTGEIGSSAMPHKVNPIHFENAEGNLGLSRVLLQHFSSKLPISRLQRDLTDSTVLRNLGVPFGHLLVALHQLLEGTQRVSPYTEQLDTDLENHWQVISEGAQVLLRRIGYPSAYEEVQSLLQDSTAQLFKKQLIEKVKLFYKNRPSTPLSEQKVIAAIQQLTPYSYAVPT